MKRVEKGWKEMVWPPVVMILAVTILLCGCGGTVPPTAASNMTRESTLPEGMEYRSEASAPETVSESLPEITVKPELLTDARTLRPIECGADADVIFFAGLDHDGEPECITVGLADFWAPGGQYTSLRVLAGESADSPIIQEHDYSVTHASWTMLYLYRGNGMGYLMEYSPYMNQRYGTYSVHIFCTDSDKKMVEAYSHTAGFALQQEDRTGFLGGPNALVAFMGATEGYIKSSLSLVSTDQGRLAYSVPGRPVTLGHDDSFFTDSWNVTGKWNRWGTIEYMSQKSRVVARGIPLLCISRSSENTVKVQFKDRNHFYTTSNPVIDQLFIDITGRN